MLIRIGFFIGVRFAAANCRSSSPPRDRAGARTQEGPRPCSDRNYSVYEISQALKEQGMALSATAVREVLAAEGFAPLPRRLDEERAVRIGPNAQAVANVGEFVLSPREFTTSRRAVPVHPRSGAA
jgi:hypothetical protein